MSERELDATDRWVIAEVEKELKAFGTLAPRWIKFPNIPVGSIGWRMGSGEAYSWMLSEWQREWTPKDHLEYLANYTPVPLVWGSILLRDCGVNPKPPIEEALHKAGLLQRGSAPTVRAFDQIGPVNPAAAEEAEGTKELAAMTFTVAMTTDDQNFATDYCLRAFRSEDQRAREAAIAGLGHIGRRFGELDRDRTKAALEEANAVSGRNYMSYYTRATLAEIREHCGWEL